MEALQAAIKLVLFTMSIILSNAGVPGKIKISNQCFEPRKCIFYTLIFPVIQGN